jgi:ABC-2 type transport system ATP-binding protein
LHVLEVRHLAKAYSGTRVLWDVSFTLAPGEIVAYLGRNGAGKTTTVKMLAGLERPTAGRIVFEGVDVTDDSLAFRRRLGYVPETADVYPFLSGREYLLLGGRLRGMPERALGRKIDSLLEILSLSAAADLALASYSKGMRQKVLLCGALLHNPDVLILDEPLSGLDVPTILLAKGLLARLALAGKTILYSTHVLEIAEKLCERVLVLHRGRVVADDKIQHLRELMQRPSLEEIFQDLVMEDDVDAKVSDIVDVMSAPVA